MRERDEIVGELKHLVSYYQQAIHEFFDETSNEFKERLQAFYGCLEQDKNSLEEYRKMVELVINFEGNLKKRIEDLVHLTDRMSQLFETKR